MFTQYQFFTVLWDYRVWLENMVSEERLFLIMPVGLAVRTEYFLSLSLSSSISWQMHYSPLGGR